MTEAFLEKGVWKIGAEHQLRTKDENHNFLSYSTMASLQKM